MKCLLAIRSLTGGGAERVVSVLANEMVNMGYEVYIAAYKRSANDYALDDRVRVITLPQRKDSALTKAMRVLDMKRIIHEIRPDVIIPFVGTVLYVTWLASIGSGSRFILTVRNNPWKVPNSAAERTLRDFIAKRSDTIMIQNAEQAEYFPENMKNRMVVVPNPLSPVFLHTEKQEYRREIRKIVSVGRLNPQKNQKMLINAFAQIVKKHEGAMLYLYGEGQEETALRSLIASLNLQRNCLLMGRANEISGVLTDADLFVMTSDYEGMPNALMEAMAVGLPCISSDCLTGPASLIAHGLNGLLFKAGDQNACFSAMEWAMNHPDDMNNMGRMARCHMLENYTSERASLDIHHLLMPKGGDSDEKTYG